MATAAKQRKAQSRKARVSKSNQNRNNTIRHIQHADQGAELVSYYWGWKADKAPEGFEFSNMTLTSAFGMPHELALLIGKSIKEASDHQLLQVINNNTQEYAGMSRDMFIMDQERKLIQTVNAFNEKTKVPVTFDELLPYIMIICCAISTLVAAGKVEQNTWNGDKFAYGYTGADAVKAFA